MHVTRATIILSGLLTFFGIADHASACSCMEPLPPQAALENADAVFLGKSSRDATSTSRKADCRVGMAGRPTTPLTEPDLWASHPALWNEFFMVKQSKLTRDQLHGVQITRNVS